MTDLGVSIAVMKTIVEKIEQLWDMEMPLNRLPALFLLLVQKIAKKNYMRVEAVILAVLTAFSCFMRQARIQPMNEPSVLWGLIIQPTSTGKVCQLVRCTYIHYQIHIAGHLNNSTGNQDPVTLGG